MSKPLRGRWLIQKSDDWPRWKADILGDHGEAPKADSRWHVWFYESGFGFLADATEFANLVAVVHGVVWATEVRVRGVQAWLEEVSAPTVIAMVCAAKENKVGGVTYVEDPTILKPEDLGS